MILEKLIYFITLINEALPLTIAKEFSRNWNKSRYDSLFGGKYRIYIPFTPPKIDIFPRLNNPIAHAISGVLNSFGYKITDYLKGLCKKNGETREQKIGKVLQKLKPEEMGFAKGDVKDLLKKFNNDNTRMAGTSNSLLIAISRHPYDIAGMSTDRDWDSCMKLGPDGGSCQEYVPKEIAEGSIIAYLIKGNDKNIKRPIARIMIKPYFDKTKRVYLGIASRTYPSETLTGFKDAVEKWLESVQSKVQGIFKLSDKVYPEVNTETIVRDKTLVARVEELKKYITLVDITWDKVLKDYLWILKAKDFKGKLELTRSYNDWFFKGTWESGTWDPGPGGNVVSYWKHGIWKNGIWKNGIWKNGTWVEGTWKDGLWERGTWKGGTWEDGLWERGTWKGGNWIKGLWEDGSFQGGTWKNGQWMDGVWKNGQWMDGVWKNGTWKNGTWKNGTWKGGNWIKGLWEDGSFQGGTWDEGIIQYEGRYFLSEFDPDMFEKVLIEYQMDILASLEEHPDHPGDIDYSKFNYKQDGIQLIKNPQTEIPKYLKSK